MRSDCYASPANTLSKVQRIACRGITGALSSSPRHRRRPWTPYMASLPALGAVIGTYRGNVWGKMQQMQRFHWQTHWHFHRHQKRDAVIHQVKSDFTCFQFHQKLQSRDSHQRITYVRKPNQDLHRWFVLKRKMVRALEFGKTGEPSISLGSSPFMGDPN